MRAGPRVDLRWEQLSLVLVAKSKRFNFISLVAGDCRLRIHNYALGGNLHAAGTVIDYYLKHPEERHRLLEGAAAVLHVDDEVRAKRFRER